MKKIAASALLLYLLDAFVLGQGLLSMGVGALALLAGIPWCVWTAFKDRPNALRRAASVAVFILLPAATLGTTRFNESLARSRAETVIAALDRYHQARGGYPDRLEQLVPEYLPAIPAAKPVFPFGDFEYANTPEHALSWISLPPYVRTSYYLEERAWRVGER